jgi:DUF3037 family protein
MEAEKQAQAVYLQLVLPGRRECNIGVFLLDQETGGLFFKLREDWEQIADPDEAELLSQLRGDFERRLQELGENRGEEFLRSLEDQLSNILRLTARVSVRVKDLQSTLDRLFEKNCVSLQRS